MKHTIGCICINLNKKYKIFMEKSKSQSFFKWPGGLDNFKYFTITIPSCLKWN